MFLKHNLNMNSFSNDFSLPFSPTNLRYSLQGNKKGRQKLSFSLSPKKDKKNRAQRHSLILFPKRQIQELSPNKRSHRGSICSQEEEIDLITKKIGERLLRKNNNLSNTIDNYNSITTAEKTGDSFRKKQQRKPTKVKWKPITIQANKDFKRTQTKTKKTLILLQHISTANTIKEASIPEIEKTKERDIVFKSTTKLNKFLIRDYHISTSQNDSASKRKLRISEMTFQNINKIKALQAYHNSQGYLDNSDNLYYQTYLNLTDSERNKTYTEREMKSIKKEYYSFKKEERLKKSKIVFQKIKDLLKEDEYQEHSDGQVINVPNLRRIVKIRKIMKKSKDDLVQKKKNFSKNEQDILLSMRKIGPPKFAKKSFKPDTIIKFKAASKAYFGIPV